MARKARKARKARSGVDRAIDALAPKLGGVTVCMSQMIALLLTQPGNLGFDLGIGRGGAGAEGLQLGRAGGGLGALTSDRSAQVGG